MQSHVEPLRTSPTSSRGLPWKLRTWLSSLDQSGPASSNVPSLKLPFQRWFKFKEAFAPSMVLECMDRLDSPPESCLDPFGGCGTSALTCQFAGVLPTLIEVNPFIADVAEAKLATYDLDDLQEDYLEVRSQVRATRVLAPLEHFSELPQTLCEPGVRGRWIYPTDVLSRLVAYRNAISTLPNQTNARLLKVMLGSILVDISNVVVNGKGRKYRENWASRQKTSADVDQYFESACLQAMQDLQSFALRGTQEYKILRGSCLEKIDEAAPADFSIFSPPYPNSFDYTDIYNLELWILGYLQNRNDNTELRTKTLRSHVQVALPVRGQPANSLMLESVVSALNAHRSNLWDRNIPEMINGYFSDMQTLLEKIRTKVKPGGSVFAVVGDSCYSGVSVPVGKILAEIAGSLGYECHSVEPLRQMRLSAQQGGSRQLDESLVHLTV